MPTITLTPEHGYVLLAASGSFLVNFWQSMKIGGKRRELKIEYPAQWSDKHPIFNCYQRAHQNTLENVPFFLAMLMGGGVRHPLVASTAGALWLVARIIYSLGYYSGEPKGRIPGAILSMLTLATLFGSTVSSGAGLLGWW
eukprot:12489.XXX_809711_810449_1 [CDS] Oithona nana genome sequencing.